MKYWVQSVGALVDSQSVRHYYLERFTYFQEAVQEICLARMLKVLAVERPLVPYVIVMEIVSVEVAPNSVYTK